MATCEYCSKRAIADVKIFGDGWARVCWTHYANRANDTQVVMLNERNLRAGGRR